MEELVRWLEERGLGEHAQLFAENDIDLDVLPRLTDQDLRELGLSVGHRRRLLVEIAKLADSREMRESAGIARRSKPGQAATRREAERRQMSVMFCDLVGSTALSTQLDPEELSDVMRAYRDACTVPIQRYGGFIARFVGDGILAYFGYPQAHEDDAERAIWAGLGVIEAVGKLKTSIGQEKGIDLAVRVGIATGRVVVGDIVGETQLESDAVVGEAPNVAARLQGLAERDTVLVAPETMRLTGERFEFRDLGTRDLKGIEAPVQIWEVESARELESRFQARSAHLMPLVGREGELSFLKQQWKLAETGTGRVVLIGGEPGIGKSRLAEALHEHVAGQMPMRPLHQCIQCSPHYANTALHPVRQQIERLAHFHRSDTPDEKLAKLRAVIAGWAEGDDETLFLLADLLAIPVEGDHPALALTARQKRDRTLSALVRWFNAVTQVQPLLLVLEDAQWMDPTTSVLLGNLTDRAREARALIIVTHRPGFAPPWIGEPHVSSLALDRLAEPEIESLVTAVAGGRALPNEFVAEIVQKTDGVPLFAEELAKGLITSDALESDNGGFLIRAPVASLGIPSSIHGPLMSRVDQLGPAKAVAQLGAAIGREFSSSLLSQVSCLTKEELADSLRRLTKSELVFERGEGPDAVYAFKHALIQETAYESVLRRNRKKLHLRIAKALEEQGREGHQADPELLAYHFSRAGAVGTAIENWKRAAEQAIARSAQIEAVNFLQRAFEDLEELADDRERSTLELELTSELAAAERAIHGYAAPRVEELYLKARAICISSGENSQRFNIEWGLMQCTFVKGDLIRANEIAESLFSFADLHPERPHVDAFLAMGMVRFHLGDFAGARLSLEKGVELSRPRSDPPNFFTHGQNPGIFCASNLAQALWFLGYPDKAKAAIDDNLDIARERAREGAHVYTFVNALTFAVRVYQCRRDAEMVRKLTEELIQLARSHHYAYYEAIGIIRQGWAQGVERSDVASISQIQEGLAALRQTGTVLGLRSCYLQMAELYSNFQMIGEALDTLDLAECRDGRGTRVWDAEIKRLRGVNLAAGAHPDLEAAEAQFRASLTIAERQKALSLQLRTSISYARLLHALGRDEEARVLLSGCMGAVDDGARTADMREAEEVMNDLIPNHRK